MKNKDLRLLMEEYKVTQWQVADELKISEATLCKRMRYELPKEEKEVITAIIKKLRGSHSKKIKELTL